MFEKGASFVEEGVGLLRGETGQDSEPKPVREGIAELAGSRLRRGGRRSGLGVERYTSPCAG
jgi:hypothetical protein